MSLSQTKEDWPAARLNKLWIWLMLDIYSEFVYKQRDQQAWEAGWDTLCKLPDK